MPVAKSHRELHGLRRRRLLLSGLAGCAYIGCGKAEGAPATGLQVLDTAAIQMRQPASALLVAITWAGERLIAVGEHGSIIYSDDAGRHWMQGQVPVDVALTCVAFVTPKIGWAAGHFGVVLKSVDGGQSWERQLDGIQANELTQLAAQDPALSQSPSPAAALALARAEHFISEGPDKPFLALCALDENKVFAFGAYRMVMSTTDGGKDWADWSLHVYDRYSHNIYATIKLGDTVYLAGEDGLIFRSSDGCNTFTPVQSSTNVTLFGILGLRNGGVLSYGVAGTCVRSGDTGKDWAAVPQFTEDNLTSGRMLRSGAILLSGEGGALYRSSDNGMSFQQISSINSPPIYDFIEVGNGDIVTVGSGGVGIISSLALNS